MNVGGHNPPHIHTKYQGYKASFTLGGVAGNALLSICVTVTSGLP
ncbi:MAG: DUF4160 domain-containing protein, partial [Bifidobacterium catenulatum]